ncbi:addiction module antidote protein [Parvibaculum sp.]|uniref:addiction module antidote protein n=1 Tax=Parvibaculum sp. TaxID=2024848 RepID=UPI003C711768
MIARVRGASQVTRKAGVTREALYKAFSPAGDPKLSTLFGVLKALKVNLSAVPVAPDLNRNRRQSLRPRRPGAAFQGPCRHSPRAGRRR